MRKANVHVTIAGTAGCQLLADLDYAPTDITIVKKRYSAFFGTELDDLLKKLRPTALVIAGINTHACVRMTVIDAYQRDYDVVLATECIASYDDVHHEITKRYLAGAMDNLFANYGLEVNVIETQTTAAARKADPAAFIDTTIIDQLLKVGYFKY